MNSYKYRDHEAVARKQKFKSVPVCNFDMNKFRKMSGGIEKSKE